MPGCNVAIHLKIASRTDKHQFNFFHISVLKRRYPLRSLQQQSTIAVSGDKSSNAKRQRLEATSFLDLDDYSLLAIFDYLKLEDLLQTSQVNRRLHNLIKSHRMYRETMSLEPNANGNLDSRMVDMLPAARKLKFALGGVNSRKIVNAITEKCVNGSLRKVWINASEYNGAINNKYNRLSPKLQGVEKVRLHAGYRYVGVGCTTDKVFSLLTKTRVKKVRLYQTVCCDHCLTTMATLPNLMSLSLINCIRVPYNVFSATVKAIGSQLKTFNWVDSTFDIIENNSRVIDLVSVWNLCNVMKECMPNLMAVRLGFMLAYNSDPQLKRNETVLDGLLSLSRLRKLSIDITAGACICNNFTLFLNRASKLHRITKLHFAWDYLLSNGAYCRHSLLWVEIQPTDVSLNLHEYRISCSISATNFDQEWMKLRMILPNLQYLNLYQMNWEYITFYKPWLLDDILKLGKRLKQLQIDDPFYMSSEVYQSLLKSCEKYRNGRRITILVRNSFKQQNIPELIGCYNENIVKLVGIPPFRPRSV